jgi:Putative dehydrogenase domain of multifunctional non-ribosomal peptide synthetases and related enzymes
MCSKLKLQVSFGLDLRHKCDVSIVHCVQLFDLMKKACPDYMNKVRLVTGDCGLPNLGIGDPDRELLCQEVNIVFHAAATVRFDEKLKTAVHINVRGTKHLLELARLMPHLKVGLQYIA